MLKDNIDIYRVRESSCRIDRVAGARGSGTALLIKNTLILHQIKLSVASPAASSINIAKAIFFVTSVSPFYLFINYLGLR